MAAQLRSRSSHHSHERSHKFSKRYRDPCLGPLGLILASASGSSIANQSTAHRALDTLTALESSLSFLNPIRHGTRLLIFHSQSILAASVSASIDVILQLRAGSGVGVARVAKEAAIGFIFRCALHAPVSCSAV